MWRSIDGGLLTDGLTGDELTGDGTVGSDLIGSVELLVVHRPKYDDWSFPKGKRDPGEDDLACALREVEEETSIVGITGAELKSVEYTDHKNRPKVVRYWTLEPAPDSPLFVPNNEVDEVVWLAPSLALDLLTYAHDRDLVAQALTSIANASTKTTATRSAATRNGVTRTAATKNAAAEQS